MVMAHELKPIYKFKRKKRVGRGGKRGTYSGRGLKGQKARAGRKFKDYGREVILRIPKQRGFKFKALPRLIEEVNLLEISRKFSDGEEVTPKTLLAKGLIKKVSGKQPVIKILGDGSLDKRLIFRGVLVSELARKKIEKAGGTIHIAELRGTSAERRRRILRKSALSPR
jgi:large subunit ribosomal protein L15